MISLSDIIYENSKQNLLRFDP